MRKILKMQTGSTFPLLISKYWSNPGYNSTSKPGEFFKKPIELKWREDLTLPEVKNDLSSAGLIKSEGLAPKSKFGIKEIGSNESKGGLFGNDTSKGVMSAAGNVLSQVQNAAFNNSIYANDENAQLQNSIRSGISDAAIKSGNPIAMAIGIGTKIVDATLDSTGLRSSNVTKDDAKKIGINSGSRVFNNAMNFLPGNFLAIGGAKTIDASKSMETEASRSGYADSVSDIDTAMNYGGKRFNFMMGNMRNKANNYIKKQNEVNQLLTTMKKTNTVRLNSTFSQELSDKLQSDLNGGTQMIQMTKEGGALKLQNGGSILIPDGALHARKHHMEDVNPELAEELTNKGIPIITTDDKGNVEQVAEVEKEEMILEKSLTEKIESLWKKGDEESMIKAGKLIVDTLFNNCDDNVNLIKNTK